VSTRTKSEDIRVMTATNSAVLSNKQSRLDPQPPAHRDGYYWSSAEWAREGEEEWAVPCRVGRLPLAKASKWLGIV